jgi:hypothetical protein
MAESHDDMNAGRNSHPFFEIQDGRGEGLVVPLAFDSQPGFVLR